MTLSEIADLVATKMHRKDTLSVTEAKAYIKARYKMLWDSRPWRDTIGMLTIASSNVTRIMILPKIIDRVIAVRWGDTANLLPQDLGTIFNVDAGLFERTGTPGSFAIISPSAVSSSPSGNQITIVSTDSNASYSVSVRGLSGNTEVSETLVANGKTSVTSINSYDEIYELSKNSTSSDLTVTISGATILTLTTTETSQSYQRIHFEMTPDSTNLKNLLILFKRRCKPLVNDSDSTEITGIDNALLAAAIADMQEGQRQFGKAQIKMNESSLMAQQMVDLERHQSASSMQLVPWDAAMTPDDYGYATMP